MSDIRFIAKTLIDQGWAVVPLVKGAKKAATSWQKKTYAPSDFGPDDGIAGKCGEPSGWRVDVDCDALEALDAARLLLPETGLVHGRASKQSSHYWYICEGIKTTQFTDVKGADGKTQMLIEIRSTGGYTAIPPSVWTNKDNPQHTEDVVWEHERGPATIDPATLYDCVRNVAITTLVARHWPGSGVRHAMVGHLTGFLLQAGIEPETVAKMVRAAATIAGDTDVDDRVKFCRNTCGKFANGENVTGGPKLAEDLGVDVVARMRAWLRLADIDAIEEMNQKHFWVRMGTKAVIGREDDDHVVFQPVKELYSEYANRKVQVGTNKDGDPQFKPLFQEWLESPTRRSYRKVVFAPPPLQCSEGDYNLWTKFAIDPIPGKWDRLQHHMLEVICSGNKEHYDYLTKLCAFTLQRPGERAQVAIVLRGDQGTGKGTFFNMFRDIIGRRHFAQLDRVEDLVGFNAMISGKVAVFADEAFWAGDKREIGTLKRIITEPTIRVTRKGIDSTEEPNCLHLFMATNEEWSVPAGLQERRFFALKVSDKYRQNTKYFDALYREMYEEGGLQAFLHDMLVLPVTRDQILNVPKTDELRTQQNQSMPLEQRWWQECLYEGKMGMINPWDSWVPVSQIYDAYVMWVKNHSTRVLDKLEFGRRMMLKFISNEKPAPKRISGGLERCANVHELHLARRIFDKQCGTNTEWPDLPPSQSGVPF